ncbi:hypothetical protein BT63DRAFT_427137 [Microthyrium microscopicum]|uniref:Nudix hydrolase domain-containing protein n=1 Tax=Microthyrium microscopicum TaxID=703497 RepID=A0A6A6U6H7_9PEZI|nr:hypothetical protein BT63DRAFT_427137 [Microthyrium microscopicum]
MAKPPMQLVDWLDDICVRFIINLPKEELESVERIIFQIEEGHWYYEDFIRPLDPTLPSIGLKQFCSHIFNHCPLLQGFSHFYTVAYEQFSAYKSRVPVRGAIMLNDNMTHAVLVKGWKNSAKWSFPRGKINKEESDFDCAVREVYEETGYDIQAAGLASDPESAFRIDRTLREQQICLFVFRGVPMDTYFEPRTRKEISKIDWYKISDLPGSKTNQQNADGTIKGNQFYMVTPFVNNLKKWIKEQRQLDRRNNGLNAPEPVFVEDSGVGTDMEAMLPEVAENHNSEARHFQSLISRLDHSTQVPAEPELSTDNSLTQTDALASHLKKLLNVGSSEVITAPVAEAPNTQIPVPRGSLMSLLQPQNSVPPHTPFEQIESSPGQARTPHHVHAGLHNVDTTAPPPMFEFPSVMPNPPPYASNQFAHTSTPRHYEPSPLQPPQQPFYGQLQMVNEASRVPNPTSHPQPGQLPTVSASHASQAYNGAAPPASSLPMPRLTAHSLNLLNAFKGPASTPDPSTHGQPSQMGPPPIIPFRQVKNEPETLLSILGVFPKEPSIDMRSELDAERSPAAQINPFNPKAAQANKLLDIFRSSKGPSPSEVGSDNLPAELAPPVAELSAGTPLNTLSQNPLAGAHVSQAQNITLRTNLQTITTHDLTSATVSGPLNAPNFETMARTKPVELGNGMEKATTPVPVHTVAPGMPLEAPQAIHATTILQRQITPANIAMAPPPLPQNGSMQMPASFDRRGTQQADQKSALMSLFKPAAGVNMNQSSNTGGVALDHQRRHSQNSPPVSPLPSRRVPVKAQYAPPYISQTPSAISMPRSRVSSFADETARASASPKSPITPVEKKFLFQFLEDVAKGGK